MKELDTTIQFGVLMVITIGLATVFGTYLTRIITFEMRPLEKTLVKVESGFGRLIVGTKPSLIFTSIDGDIT